MNWFLFCTYVLLMSVFSLSYISMELTQNIDLQAPET